MELTFPHEFKRVEPEACLCHSERAARDRPGQGRHPEGLILCHFSQFEPPCPGMSCHKGELPNSVRVILVNFYLYWEVNEGTVQKRTEYILQVKKTSRRCIPKGKVRFQKEGWNSGKGRWWRPGTFESPPNLTVPSYKVPNGIIKTRDYSIMGN